jgi:hypothetical protein
MEIEIKLFTSVVPNVKMNFIYVLFGALYSGGVGYL